MKCAKSREDIKFIPSPPILKFRILSSVSEYKKTKLRYKPSIKSSLALIFDILIYYKGCVFFIGGKL